MTDKYAEQELDEYKTLLYKKRYNDILGELVERYIPLFREKEKLEAILGIEPQGPQSPAGLPEMGPTPPEELPKPDDPDEQPPPEKPED